MLTLDHLAVAAETLEAGRAHVEAALGVALQPGGRHARFGTHNMLMGLADGLYLEVIAVDPAAPAPADARWFNLDAVTGPPRLANWICRTPAIGPALARFPQAGRAVALERGDLRWSMAVPESGVLPFDNLFPALIHWPGEAHPAARLADTGCALTRLTVRHPRAEALRATLAPALHDDRLAFDIGAPGLFAEIMTPHGPRILD